MIPIPIPVGETWTVTQRGSFRASYRCGRCGHEAQATVKAETRASEFNPLFFDSDGAMASASARAESAMSRAVGHHLGLVPCPKCGTSGEGLKKVVSEQRTGAVMTALFLTLIVFGIGITYTAITDSVPAFVATGVAMVAVAVASYRGLLRRAVRRRIEFSRESVVFG
jgi:hypothetical protein